MSKGSFTVVPTPVGNLKDITYRAVQVLQECDIVFAEDTRTALALLNHLDIKKKVESYHKDNEVKSAPRILSLLDDGKNIALISEAGTPCISDPGYIITKELTEKGYEFTALPGATAFVPALVMSGLDVSEFYFRGFLPQKSGEKKKELERLSKIGAPVIFYESPKRAKKTVVEIFEYFSGPLSISREISKLHEETLRVDSPDDIENLTEKGEFVIIAQNTFDDESAEELGGMDIKKCITELHQSRLSQKDIVSVLKVLGVKRNRAYELTQDIIGGSSEEE